MTTTQQLHEKKIEVECLDCGMCRHVTGLTYDELGECSTCGYVGWTFPHSITEPDMRSLQRWHRDLRLAVA